MNNKIKFRPFSKFEEECKMTIDEFKQGAECYCFTDDDGHGYYATENEISNVYIDFGEILNGNYPSWITHVCWFNK